MADWQSSFNARLGHLPSSFWIAGRRLHGFLQASLGLACLATLAFLPSESGAAEPRITFKAQDHGKTPFIEMVHFHMDEPDTLAYVRFTIAPKPGSVTRAISTRYSSAYLAKRGFLDAQSGIVTVPVYGLYQNYTNAVKLEIGFVDEKSQTDMLSITTAPFGGGIYNHPTVVQARSTKTALSYDFIMLKAFSSQYTPIIIDTDGEVRWVGTAGAGSMQVIFYDNSFFLVAGNGTTIRRMEYDGAVTDVADYASKGVANFHHNFDYGKAGILTGVNTAEYLESTIMEVNAYGAILHTWDMANIITNAMLAGGDDPTKFVTASGSQYDWFHNNSATYRPSDDSIVISSRENFVIALDYQSQAIKWILGDPTKQWYQFPSLRKYALAGTGATQYPVGQHAVNIYRDSLVLFDNGFFSSDHFPQGVNRTYSTPRKYVIDQAAGTATEIWHHLAGETIDSPICSSCYEDKPENYLIDYATAGPSLYAEIVGLSPGQTKVFDYRFKELFTLATAWNATILHLEDMVYP